MQLYVQRKIKHKVLFSHTWLHTISIFNILYWCGTFVTIDKQILIYY